MKKSITLSCLMAGLLVAAGWAQAQTSNVPTKAGEAQTTKMGVPNAAEKTMDKTRMEVRDEAKAANKAGTIPRGEIGSPGKGQMAGSKGESDAGSGSGKTRAEARADRDMKRASRKADSNTAMMRGESKMGPKGETGTPGQAAGSGSMGGAPKQ